MAKLLCSSFLPTFFAFGRERSVPIHLQTRRQTRHGARHITHSFSVRWMWASNNPSNAGNNIIIDWAQGEVEMGDRCGGICLHTIVHGTSGVAAFVDWNAFMT